MAATYNSLTNLSLGQVPNIDSFEDVYTELLDIHNALEILLNNSDLFVLKTQSTRQVTGNYTVDISDGTILVDASAGSVTVTLHPVAAGVGYHNRIKCIALGLGFTVTVVGDSGELIDNDAGGVQLGLYEAIHVQNDGVKWWMID